MPLIPRKALNFCTADIRIFGNVRHREHALLHSCGQHLSSMFFKRRFRGIYALARARCGSGEMSLEMDGTSAWKMEDDNFQ